jgi:hypothetical protein
MPAESPLPAQLLDPLLDACNSLVLSHHRLAECLHTAGLINEQSALAVLAGEDQIDAAITHLRTRARR